MEGWSTKIFLVLSLTLIIARSLFGDVDIFYCWQETESFLLLLLKWYKSYVNVGNFYLWKTVFMVLRGGVKGSCIGMEKGQWY